jgi:uncharacterized Fe-S center protein
MKDIEPVIKSTFELSSGLMKNSIDKTGTRYYNGLNSISVECQVENMVGLKYLTNE